MQKIQNCSDVQVDKSKYTGGAGQARDAGTQEFAVVGIHSVAPTKRMTRNIERHRT